jgi:GT2 family glycosyltransferase
VSTISVIIVSWNARDYLRGCLLSIRQVGGVLIREIIVVDNASTDGSPDVVENEFPEVILIRSKENLGFARANNLGIKRSTGPWLALVNSDVVVHANCFEELVAHLELHSDAGLVGPKIFGKEGKIQLTRRRLPTLWNALCRALALDELLARLPGLRDREIGPEAHETLGDAEVISGCFWLARREAVDQVGILDERFFFYAEDVDWCKRFWDEGWKVVFVPKATATHFGGGSSANAPFRFSIELLRANLTYWHKHRGPLGKAAFYSLSLIHHTLRFVQRGLTKLTRRNPSDETVYKFERSKLCLRWLLTGKGT